MGDVRFFIFSGGTAFNSCVEPLAAMTTRVTYCLPVSDNGGSTAEIMRVLGGPAIGDIRSRLLRLSAPSLINVRLLLQHRLPSSSELAKREWTAIVEGSHQLWNGIESADKQIVRSFLVHFHSSVLRVGQVPGGDTFNYAHGSIGNFFFTGARLFFSSLPAAIKLWQHISGIPRDTHVLPVINTINSLTIIAELTDGTRIFGQNEISHPGGVVDKANAGRLSLSSVGRIKRIFYLNDCAYEFTPSTNPDVLDRLLGANMIVYAMGSLYTSIVPCLILPGVGDVIVHSNKPKVLILNTSTDRETSGFTADDFLDAIATACRTSLARPSIGAKLDSFVNYIVYAESGSVPVSKRNIEEHGITAVAVPTRLDEGRQVIYEEQALVEVLVRIAEESNGSRVLVADANQEVF